MAEDNVDNPAETAPPPEPIVDESSPPENDDEAKEPADDAPADNGKNDMGKNNNKGKRGRGKKEEVPIEELYDLTKPIKRIERPSKDAHEAEVSAIESSIEELTKERRTLQSKIDSATGNSKSKNTPLGRERDALNKLKNRKGLMIEQKRRIRTRLEIVKSKADKLMGEAKNTRSSIKFSSAADIDKEIARLQRKQETTSMSLSDEKRLLKEIETLQASKRTAEQLRSKEGDIDKIKEERKAVQAELNAKDKEIDAIQKEIDAQSTKVQEMTDKQSIHLDQVDKLVEERDAVKAKIDEKFKEKNDLRSQFRKATDDWYHNQRAIKAQRQMQYEEEKKRRDEEHAAWLKKKEEEELKKTPYEEEMALCDYLAEYLTKTYLIDANAEKLQQQLEVEKKAKADVVAVKDDPFAGLKAINKKDDDEEIYFGKGKGKKAKAKKTNKKVPVFSLNIDLFDQFGLLTLTPPTSLEAVPASVEELKAKKKWYSEQPRGSVPTAADIRKANEKEAAKVRGDNNDSGDSKGGKRGSNGKKANFTISNDDFVPLGSLSNSASGSVNSSWGQKADSSVTASSEVTA